MKTKTKTKTLFKSAVACMAALALFAIALVGCSAPEPQDEPTTSTVTINIDAEKWADTSTPAIAKFKSNGVTEQEFTHAFYAGTENIIELEKGEWTVEFVAAPINEDGSSYELPQAQDITVPGDADTFTFTLIPADAITNEQLLSTLDAIKSAVLLGDDTISGDNATSIIQLAQTNASSAPSANVEEIQNVAAEAEANVSEKSSGASVNNNGTQSATTSNNASDGASKPSQSTSGGSNAPAASAPAKPAHQHSWVDITEPRTITDKAAWTEKIPVRGVVCSCGATFTDKGAANAHIEATRHSYSSGTVDYNYVNHPAQTHTETVTVGQRCTSCGATK